MKPFAFARNTDVLWLGLLLFVILSIAMLLPVQPNDYWWYLRLGNDIVSGGQIPTVDTYTSTQFGQPMAYHSWLSAVLFWATHQAGGLTLTVLLRAVLLAIFYALLWRICRLAGAGPRLATLLTLIAALAGSNNWAMRPQLFSYPLFALALFSLWQWRLGRSRWVWALPVVALLWVNFHGAFVLCFLLVGAALVGGGGNRKTLAIALGAMFLASMLNPRGLGAWEYVLNLLSAPAVQYLAAEWLPATNQSWQGKLFFAWLLIFAPLVALSKNRLPATDWLWFLGLGWMAISGVRHIIWFLAVLAPLCARLLVPLVGRWVDRGMVKGIPAFNGGITALLLALPLLLLPSLRETWWPEAPPILSSDTPVDATNWLDGHPELPGSLWCELAYSSYLIYALPERPVWIDTRFELFPVAQWERYIEINEAAPEWERLLNDEGIELLMLDQAAQPRLIRAVRNSMAWQAQYSDERVIVFSRKAVSQ